MNHYTINLALAMATWLTGASHSRSQGRLTRDYKADQVAISGKIAIFDVPDFFVKKIRKNPENPENRFFGLLGPK